MHFFEPFLYISLPHFFKGGMGGLLKIEDYNNNAVLQHKIKTDLKTTQIQYD